MMYSGGWRLRPVNHRSMSGEWSEEADSTLFCPLWLLWVFFFFWFVFGRGLGRLGGETLAAFRRKEKGTGDARPKTSTNSLVKISSIPFWTVRIQLFIELFYKYKITSFIFHPSFITSSGVQVSNGGFVFFFSIPLILRVVGGEWRGVCAKGIVQISLT